MALPVDWDDLFNFILLNVLVLYNVCFRLFLLFDAQWFQSGVPTNCCRSGH